MCQIIWDAKHTPMKGNIFNHNNKTTKYCLWLLLCVLLSRHQQFTVLWLRTAHFQRSPSNKHNVSTPQKLSLITLSRIVIPALAPQDIIQISCSVCFTAVFTFCLLFLFSTGMGNEKSECWLSCPHCTTRASARISKALNVLNLIGAAQCVINQVFKYLYLQNAKQKLRCHLKMQFQRLKCDKS